MLIEALQMGDLEQFRMLLDEARCEEGRRSLEDGQFTALRHAIRGRAGRLFCCVHTVSAGILHL